MFPTRLALALLACAFGPGCTPGARPPADPVDPPAAQEEPARPPPGPYVGTCPLIEPAGDLFLRHEPPPRREGPPSAQIPHRLHAPRDTDDLRPAGRD